MKRSFIHSLSLEQLFRGTSLFVDKDGDGYPDALNLKIIIPPSLKDPYVWVGLLNLTARLAFEVVAFDSPILQKGRTPQPGTQNLILDSPGGKGRFLAGDQAPAELYRAAQKTLYLRGSSAHDMMTLLNTLALGSPRTGRPLPPGWKRIAITAQPSKRVAIFDARGHCLAAHSLPQDPLKRPVESRDQKSGQRRRHSLNLLSLVDDGGLFEKVPNNPRAITPRVYVQIENKELTPEIGLALSQIVSSIALYVTQIGLPLVYMGDPPRGDVIVKISEEDRERPEIRFLRPKKAGARTILLRGSSPSLAKAMTSWFNWAMTDGGPGGEPMERFRSRVNAFRDLAAGRGYWGRWAQLLIQKAEKAPVSMPPAPSSTRAKIARACRALSIQNPPLSPGPEALYRTAQWRGEIHTMLQLAESVPLGKGPLFGEILVSKPLARRRALKSRLEKALRARGYEPYLDVINAYKPGLSWLLEHILPLLEAQGPFSRVEISYQPFRASGKALEMRSRWLQEIYPAPELLAQRLKLGPAVIQMIERTGLKAVYRIRAWDRSHRRILDRSFSPPWSRIPYLNADAGIGFVHPTTGRMRLWQANTVILEETVPTDREAFWQIFQNRWIPLLEKEMEARLAGESSQDQPAFWQEILIQVWMEETDERLHFLEERVSPMEALHEDLYFVLLEAYTAFSRRHKLPPSLQLGKILPVLRIRSGKGFPKASLKARPFIWPQAPQLRPSPLKPGLTALCFDKGFWRMAFNVRTWRHSSDGDSFVKIARSWGFEVERTGKSSLVLSLKPPPAGVHQETRKQRSRPRGDAPPKNRILKANEVESWIERLNRFPRLRVWEASRSWQGLPVYVIETVAPHCLSIPKLRLLKPSLLFNARHHANEVSSTNAALNMAWFIASTKEGMEWVKKVNVAWIPLENPDGVATFEQLFPTGRDHKLHAARYNALGAEFYRDYFRPKPRFGEARAKPRVWRRWLPEIMVDHHGVPSHEWDQPFSGYAPFRFREFWIPRSFVYLYVPFMDKRTHPLYEAAHMLARSLRRAMAQEKEILSMNRKLAALYRTYALEREPRVFPPFKGEPLLILPPTPRNYKTNFAVRYPEVTKCELIVEVPDEVTRGASLEQCVRAHLTIQEAVIRFLSNRPRGGVCRDLDLKTGILHLRWEPGRQ